MKHRAVSDRDRSAVVRRGLQVLLDQIDTQSISDFLFYDKDDPHCRVTVEDVAAAVQAINRICVDYGVVGRRRCRVCGCHDEAACPQGCWWVEEDLCSCCVPGGIAAAAKRARGRQRSKS